MHEYCEGPLTRWFKVSFSTSNNSPISASVFQKICSDEDEDEFVNEMLLVVEIGLLAQCGAAAMAGVALL